MVQLDTDPFLNELNKLFERNKENGSVTCTMKRSETLHMAAVHTVLCAIARCTAVPHQL